MNIPLYKIEDFIGTNVIVRSNEDEPYQVGLLNGYQKHEKSGQYIPIVDINGTDFLCFGIIVPYDEGLAGILDMLSHQEQLNLLTTMTQFITLNKRKCGGS